MSDEPHQFIPNRTLGICYYRYQRSRDTYRDFNPEVQVP